jgi:hypothetical protein
MSRSPDCSEWYERSRLDLVELVKRRIRLGGHTHYPLRQDPIRYSCKATCR